MDTLFSISDIQAQLPIVGRDMIKLVLADLKAEGTIALQGKGRGAKYSVTSLQAKK